VSKGVGEVAAGQIEVNSRKALMEAEEEMRARLAEAAESRTEARNIAAEERNLANIPRQAEAIAASDEAILSRRFGEGSAYPGLIQQQLAATETAGQKLEQQRTRGLLGDEQHVRTLRRMLSATPEGSPERAEISRQLQDLEGTQTRLDPRVEAELEFIQSQINTYQKDRSEAIERGYEIDDPVIKDFDAKIAPLRRDAERLLGRSSGAADPLGLF